MIQQRRAPLLRLRREDLLRITVNFLRIYSLNTRHGFSISITETMK
jgi:hypothetical protein